MLQRRILKQKIFEVLFTAEEFASLLLSQQNKDRLNSRQVQTGKNEGCILKKYAHVFDLYKEKQKDHSCGKKQRSCIHNDDITVAKYIIRRHDCQMKCQSVVR